MPSTSFPQRILAIKLADLGDVLNVTPALRALRRTFPNAQLDILVNPHTASLLEGSTLVDEVIILPKVQMEGLRVFSPASWPILWRSVRVLRARGYDTVVNFHHLTTPLGRVKQRFLIAATGASARVGLDNGHGGWLTHSVEDKGFGARPEVVYWLDLAARLGATHPDVSLDLPVGENDHKLVEAMLAQQGLAARGFAVLHPGSGGFSLARRWDPPKFAALAVALERRYRLRSILVGTAGDDVPAVLAHAKTPIIDFSQRLSIKQLAALLSRASLFVGADSGVMHVAAAMRAPIVAIFGPTNHRAWAPWTPYSPSRVVRTGIDCSPCAYVGHDVGQRNGCAARTCLALLDVDQVMAAVDEVLR
ncbi:MAG: glycosyltransferase family 9 protein [Chloroflexi bacterium]|nr:glycosyltransferase family 9 protein [Chloroflexota bacterium]